MENDESALKNGNRKEKALTGSDQNCEDEAELKVQENRGVSVSLNDENTFHRSNDSSNRKEKALTGSDQNCEDSFFNDLLDLPNVFLEDEAELKVQENRGVSVSLNDENTLHRSNDSSTAAEDFELPVPMDDLAELECLSKFVEDSFTSSSARPLSPRWLSGAEFLDEPTDKREKKKMKKLSSVEDGRNGGQTQTRRCSHCGVEKTPQWRTGPSGPYTLCNACGMRYRAGRLLPEYRPTSSPTFSRELHSNYHHRVIEMRRKKETSDDADETSKRKRPPK